MTVPLLNDEISKEGVWSRLSYEEGIQLLKEEPLPALKKKAVLYRNRKNPSDRVTFVIDTNPNYTNICTARCTFCAFQRLPGSSSGYTLTVGAVMDKIEKSLPLGITTVLLQGGHHPDLPLDYYVELVAETKNRFPEITPHYFSASEICNIADVNDLSVHHVLEALYHAGQRTLPGGGAEILTDRVKQILSPFKIGTARWLEVHETAHQIGYRSTATMMYGHVENDADIVKHLLELRDVQDRTQGFTAFVPWSYKPINKKTVKSGVPRGPDRYYQILAFSRIFLDNFDHIQASWFSEGKETGSVALGYGADDFGGTLFEENVHKAAKFVNQTTVRETMDIIRAAGYNPVQRTTLYETYS